MSSLRVGMGQLLVEWGQPEANLERAAQMVRRAAEQKCSVVVLPECLDLGWTFPEAGRLAEPIPGRYSSRLASAAQESGLYIVAGLTEQAADRLYNAAVLISPKGEILHKHRKINELEIARSLYTTGDSLAVARTGLGTIGINICADNFPASLALGRALAQMGSQVLLSPCAWAVEADYNHQAEPYGQLWRNSYSTLAREYGISVVGVSNVGWIPSGVWGGRKCIGCSLAVGPGGKILAQGPYGEAAESFMAIDVPMRPS